MFAYSDDNKRYHTLSFYNKQRYGAKVYKAAVDAGSGCPNRDGTKGVGGCIFCLENSRYFARRIDGDVYGSVTAQLTAERDRICQKHPNSGIIAYFQAGSNTYVPDETIKDMLRAAEDFGTVGAAIATRADCIDEAKIKLLCEFDKRLPLTVELGLQTVHDRTALLINRCHTFGDFLNGYKMLKDAGLRVCVHIINGLPEESEEDMLKTARVLGQLRPDAVKIHLLHVLKGTPLENMYLKGEYIPMSMDNYISVTVRQLELLPPECVIERLTGDGDKRTLTAPLWSRNKIAVLGGIDRLMAREDTWQGKKYKKGLCDENTDI